MVQTIAHVFAYAIGLITASPGYRGKIHLENLQIEVDLIRVSSF